MLLNFKKSCVLMNETIQKSKIEKNSHTPKQWGLRKQLSVRTLPTKLLTATIHGINARFTSSPRIMKSFAQRWRGEIRCHLNTHERSKQKYNISMPKFWEIPSTIALLKQL